jgi:predicted CXXCH cytochrome family protein
MYTDLSNRNDRMDGTLSTTRVAGIYFTMIEIMSKRRLIFFKSKMLWIASFSILCCCSQQTRYRVVSTLFDGVPEPAQSVPVQSDSAVVAQPAVIAQTSVAEPGRQSIHPPYQEKNCAACHDRDQGFQLAEKSPDLCYECHDNFTKKYNTVHAPVEEGLCLDCHNQHFSANAHLLVQQGSALCVTCHDQTDIVNIDAQHRMTADCLDCHDPHGSNGRHLSK